MANTDTPSPPATSPDYLQQALQYLQGGGGAIQGPAAPATPAVNPNLPITSLLGEAFGGGVSPLYPMSEAQQTQAGNAALLNFGIGMLQNSSGPVRHSLGQAIASGLLGAQGSLAGVREGQAQMLDVQNKQLQNRLEVLKTALPLLTLQQQQNIARGLPTTLTGSSGAAPGNLAATGAPITGSGIAPADMVGSIASTLNIPTADAAAIASNFHAESGLIPGINEIKPAPGTRGGYGLAQWTDTQGSPRRTDLEAYATANKLNVADPATQLAFMKQEIAQNYPNLLPQMAAAKTPEEKAAIFYNTYEGGPPRLLGAHTAMAAPFAALPPPGSAPGGSRTATAPPAATTPPAPVARPTAAPGGGFGTSAFNAPSTTVMPAPPGGGATAPNTTAEVPPVPTPQMAAARAVAARTNRPAPIAGTDGLFVNPNGSVGPGPGGGGLGRRADVGAIVQGAQTAQTTMPPTAALAAGPAAGGAVTPAAVTPPPASAFGGGAFSGPAPAMIGAPAATPPAQPTAPAVTAPPATPAKLPLYVRPPLTPEQQAQFDTNLPPAQQATLEAAYQAARRQALTTGDEGPARDALANLQKAQAERTQQANQARAAYDTKQQELEQNATVEQAKLDAATATQLSTQQHEERLKTIESANTRLAAEAADQGKRNSDIVTAFGNNADAATRQRGSLAQARSTLINLPSNPASLLSNETTRPIVAGWFGGTLPGLATNATNADVYVAAMKRVASEMSPKTLVGGERPSNISQYQDMLPGLAASPEGRELGVNFADDYAENQQKIHDWLINNRENPAFFNKRLGVPDMDRALVASRAEPSLQMPQLPPMPSTFDAKAASASAADRQAQAKYAASIKPGQPFYAWQPGSDGRLHAVKTTWARGSDGNWTPVPGSAP